MSVFLLMFVSAITTIDATQTMELILFKANETGGQCLDGSPAGFYYSPPPSGSSDLWVINLEGGGACVDEATCLSRANSSLGSSKYWPILSTHDPTDTLLSNDPISNPDFYFGHHIHAPYCSSDCWSGQRKEPSTNPDTWGLYFSGHLIFETMIQYLSYNMEGKASLLDAQYILLTGSSAGGLGTFGNINWLYDQYQQMGHFKDNVTIKAAPEAQAGWFLPGNTTDQPSQPMMPPNDYPHWLTGQTGGAGHNDSQELLWDAYLIPECVQALGSDKAWHCGSVHNIWPYLKVPIFVLENRFDRNQIEAQMLMPHPQKECNNDTIGYVEYYGINMDRSVLTQVVDEKNVRKNGLFYPSCFDHGASDGVFNLGGNPNASTLINGYNATEILGDWFWQRNELPDLVYDTCNNATNELPCNPMCDPYPPK